MRVFLVVWLYFLFCFIFCFYLLTHNLKATSQISHTFNSLSSFMRGILKTQHWSSIQFSLWPHGLQHDRLPCPSPTPRAYSNSCPLHWWCHPTILCHPLLLLPSIFPSIGVFSSESVLHIRWPKYWHFSFSINPFKEYSGWISFRIDGLDLLAVQGTLKSLLQHYSTKTLEEVSFIYE